MSERTAMRRWGAAAMVGALCVVSSRVTHAQDRASLEQRIGTLSARYLKADSTLRAFDDSVVRLNVALDTASVGALKLSASPRQMDTVAMAAAIADRRLRERFGTTVSRLASMRFIVREPEARNRASNFVQLAVSDSTGHEKANGFAFGDVKQLAVGLEAMAGSRLTQGTGRAFVAWLQGPLPLDTMNAMAWSRTRLVVVSSPARIGRGCYDGTLSDCAMLLGVTQAADPVLEFYDPAERRQIVRHEFGGVYTRSANRTSCLAGDDAACQTLLRSASFSPIPRSIRVSLVEEALKLGGTRAYERLIDTNSEDPRDRLAAAAGVPFDSLVSAWRSNVHDSRVPSDAMRPSIAAASLGWIVLCIGLSMRSSRWR